MSDSRPYTPNWLSPPGETIGERLHARRITNEEFSSASGISIELLQLLLSGEVQIDEPIASQLEHVLGGSTQFWLRREHRYRAHLTCIAETYTEELLKNFPVAEMTRLGWLAHADTKAERAKHCLAFFGTADLPSLETRYESLMRSLAFRRSNAYNLDKAALLAWLRMGEVAARRCPVVSYSETRFRERLPEVRKLTREKFPGNFMPKLQEICASCGVAFVVVKTPHGCPVSGATRYMDSGVPLIQLSIRYLTDDHFWFTFFHEAAHVLLHLQEHFIDGDGLQQESDALETEANELATQLLIPSQFNEALKTVPLSATAIVRLAREINVSPGIVVGQLQHLRRVPFNHFNGMKRRYIW